MSARNALVLFTLFLALGVVLVLPSSLYAANGRPVHPQSNVLARPPAQDEDTPQKTDRRPIVDDEEGEQYLLERDADFLSQRLSGDEPMSIEQAAESLVQAQAEAERLRAGGAAERAPNAYGGDWAAQGPNPIVTIDRSGSAFIAYSGRIGALTILPNGRYILGGAQGGLWTWNEDTYAWTPRTDNIGKLAIGALAYAPSNPEIVYAGTGEGELSGDSYAGNGVLKSPDGGLNWYLASGNSFIGISISALVVDPTDENHLYVTTIRGRGGARRVTQPPNTQYGIYESTDGGVSWTFLKGYEDPFKGATDIVIDPQDPQKLYASFWGVGIFKSTDGGSTWQKAMGGLPADADWYGGATRFALSISHPEGSDPLLITGFDYFTDAGEHVPSRVWKSEDEGGTWTPLPVGSGADSVEDYCAQQCTYDNVVAIAPDNQDVMYAAGQWNYAIESGGIYRSDDGGNTWKDIGYYTHPDYHAIAFDPSDSDHILVGNDGGVWRSYDGGGRPSSSDPLDETTWENLNAAVNPANGAVLARTGLQLAQYSSMSTRPANPASLWGGTQDNGTQRRSTLSPSWFDIASGDGGQAIADPEDNNYLYGAYFGITPYRYDNAGAFFYSNAIITNGIDTNDRAEFYVPITMNKLNPEQLFLGTYRLYRTDNARAGDPGDVLWNTISPDLTTGCLGTAPNGARGCFISAIGVSGGGGGVWVGTDDALVQYSPNALTSDSPNWVNKTKAPLPNRPVTSISVDQSNSRWAVVSFGGFNKTTPEAKGHVFRTKNAGKTWVNISGNLPNAPVNSVVVDPSYPNTIYAGTDVGPFVTTDGGNSWAPLGNGFPLVAIWQFDLDPMNRTLAAGTHGRGAWRIDDAETEIPALVLSKTYPDTPVGPDTDVTFNINIRNIGNADATGVSIKDKMPANVSFVSASDGGFTKKGFLRWTDLTVPAGDTTTVSVTLHVNANATGGIKNKNLVVTSAEGVGARGTPVTLPLSPPTATMLSPQEAFNGARPTQTVDYAMTVRNLGYQTDTFKIAQNGSTFPTEIREETCSTVITETSSLNPGDTFDFCLRVTVPGDATNGQESVSNVRAVSQNDNTVKDFAYITTRAVTVNILLVDNDNTSADTIGQYTDALDQYGQGYDIWDLAADPNLPQEYLNAHPNVVWYTGAAWPEPLTPYGDSKLAPYLDQGGKLFLSGQDLLDQNGGTTDFVYDYLHVDWDGSDDQNDIPTTEVHSAAGNPVTDGIGSVPLGFLACPCTNQITPISPAIVAFRDDEGEPDALTVATDGYQVVFLAFPFEIYGNATQRADLMARVLDWFNEP